MQVVDVDEHGSIWTQTGRLDQVEAAAREAIAITLDVAEDDVDVVDDTCLPERLADEVGPLHALRERRDELDRRLVEVTRAAAIDLRSSELDLSLRDIGSLVDLSHQRVTQILDGEDFARSGSASTD